MAKEKGFKHNWALVAAGLTRFGLGMVLLGLFLFLFAGDLRYWNAWLYVLSFTAAIFSFGIYLYTTDQELLAKRLNTKEKEQAQKAYTTITGISFLGTFAVCGLDYRFDWSHVPTAVVFIALAVMLAGFGLFVATLLQNRFASRVIEIQDKQKVIDTGVYAVIRHPLYTAALIMFFASPIVLGSFWAVIPMCVYLVGIILRIQNEEKVLHDGLEGYTEYTRKVKYRLVPFIW